MPANSMDCLVSLCKRRGFIFPSSQLYGGVQGLYDYGPLGIELKNQLKQAWWTAMVYDREDIEGLDTTILTSPITLTQSGHVDTFTDPLVDCRSCKSRHRADFIPDGVCPACGSSDLTPPREFNLMFQTQAGPIVSNESLVYLRPETAQGIFTNFKNVLDSTSRKIPFGIAQIGKAFRNEITPRNFIFRVREFEQMELEFFVKPGEDETWHTYWVEQRKRWWQEQGLAATDLVASAQSSDELAHYAKATVDLLYRFPHGLEELEGIANRTDFDLGAHTKAQSSFELHAKVPPNPHSTTKMAVQDLATKKWFVPYVIEPSAGVDRGVLAVLAAAYTEEAVGDSTRIVLRLKPHLAPVKVAVIPLAKNKTEIVDCATRLTQTLKAQRWGRVVFENTGNIGKSYRKHDEIGTPVCVTVDFETIGATETPTLAGTVTVRNRDTLQQERVAADRLVDYLKDTIDF